MKVSLHITILHDILLALCLQLSCRFNCIFITKLFYVIILENNGLNESPFKICIILEIISLGVIIILQYQYG